MADTAMAVYPEYSKREIKDAGKVLAETGLQQNERTFEAFRVAQNVRASYNHPLWDVRQELKRVVKDTGAVASRLKRMSSIRNKLRNTDLNLYQMQDIGGVRAIFDDRVELDRVLDHYVGGATRHRVHRIYDYANDAKGSGYRSVHVVLKYRGTKYMGPVFDRQFLEVQLRTTAQHNWATAVEAVGLFKGEDLKGSRGSKQWLDFFRTMSRYIASTEGLGDWTGADKAKLSIMNNSLDAVRHLEAYSIEVDRVGYSAEGGRFMIQFDPAARSVRIQRFFNDAKLIETYNQQEAERRRLNTVIVNVSRYHELQTAYPNYFLDVQSFLELLKDALGRNKKPAPIKVEASEPSVILDPKFNFLKDWRKRRA